MDSNLSFAIDVAKHTKDEVIKEFKYINEVLYRKEKIYVPTEWDKEVIIEEFHDAPYTRHPGMAKTYKAIKVHYWWPNM
jgi:sensor c-di-GMP phosphodiesterase-like protein